MGLDQQDRTSWLTRRAIRHLPDAVEQAGRRAASLMVRAGVSEHSRWPTFVRGCSEDLGRRLWFLIVDTEDPPIVCPGCHAIGEERCASWCIDRELDERDEHAEPDGDDRQDEGDEVQW